MIFLLSRKMLSIQKKTDSLTCGVNYKGNCIGVYIYKNCKSIDDITEKTEIKNIFINKYSSENLDISQFSVNGITIDDSHEKLFEALGNDYETGLDESQIIYRDGNSSIHFGFGKFDDSEDSIVAIYVNFS